MASPPLWLLTPLSTSFTQLQPLLPIFSFWKNLTDSQWRTLANHTVLPDRTKKAFLTVRSLLRCHLRENSSVNPKCRERHSLPSPGFVVLFIPDTFYLIKACLFFFFGHLPPPLRIRPPWGKGFWLSWSPQHCQHFKDYQAHSVHSINYWMNEWMIKLSILMLNMMGLYTVYMFVPKTVFQKTVFMWDKNGIITISEHSKIPYLSYYKQYILWERKLDCKQKDKGGNLPEDESKYISVKI